MLKLAWRNLWRHRTRSAISLSAITLSFASLLVTFGISDASYQQIFAVAVKTAGGSVLIHARGWWERRSAELLLHDPAPVLSAVRSEPGVRAVIPRVISQGLLSSPRGAEGVRLLGIDPQAERSLLDLQPFVRRGHFLAADDRIPLVIGDRLARRLGVSLGDRVVLTATDAHGELSRALFRISGIFEPRAGLDEGVAYTSLAAAQSALDLGHALTEIGVVLHDDQQREQVEQALRKHLGHAIGAAGGLELLTWDQALPELDGAIRADKAFAWLFGLVAFVVVGFGIANTLLMSVLERVRELGLLAALGMTPGAVARLVLAETAVLCLVALTLGYGLGFSIHGFLHHRGIDLAALSGVKIEFAGVTMTDWTLRSVVDPVRWIGAGLALAGVMLICAGYPAWRASRLDPVVAMRTFA